MKKTIIQRLDDQIHEYYKENCSDLPSVELTIEQYHQLVEETRGMLFSDYRKIDTMSALMKWRNTKLFVHHPKGVALK